MYVYVQCQVEYSSSLHSVVYSTCWAGEGPLRGLPPPDVCTICVLQVCIVRAPVEAATHTNQLAETTFLRVYP